MAKNKKWNIGGRYHDKDTVRAISNSLHIEDITAELLVKRGYDTPEKASAFIQLEAELFHDPFLLKDMDKACARIEKALLNNEKISVYGDYDVDGVTSVSILCLYLRENGGNVTYYIPNRAGEGYGVNKEAIKKLADDGVSLFITVDTGITASSEAEYAKELGCDMIVTDHHECHGELPLSAEAVINPKRPDCEYPFKELAGVGVAFKLITALEYTLRKGSGRATDGFLEYVCQKYIDLVAIGTVADVMPLYDENRLIVSMGLASINRGARAGVRALIEAADGGKSGKRKPATSSLIGFTVAPRINAAGRISSASRAVELFFTDSYQKAQEISAELCEINRRRQYEENKIIEQINERLGTHTDSGKKEYDPVIVLSDEGWHHGVIGIVSSRVTERLCHPSILISFEGDIGKGSGRSIKGLNLVDALDACSDLLIKFGGHELAAGLSIERDKLSEFTKRINDYAREHLTEESFVTDIDIDCGLYPDEISLKLAEELLLLEPFGISNPVPIFATSNVTVTEALPIGSGKHTKFILEAENIRLSAVLFGSSPEELGVTRGDTVDIAYNLSVNEFRDTKSEQLLIRDIRFSRQCLDEKKSRLEEYKSALALDKKACYDNLPAREDFVSVFLRMRRALPEGKGSICLNCFLDELNSIAQEGSGISYVKLRLVLDILCECGIISLEESESGDDGLETFIVTINNLEKKVSLEKSCLYQKLMNTAALCTPI